MSDRSRHVVIVLAVVLFVFVGLLHTGCNGSNPKIDEEQLKKKAAEFEQEITNDILDVGSVLVGDAERSTEFGRTSGGAGLMIPEDFPEDVPFLDKARLTMVHRRGNQLMVGYTVPMPWQAASEALQTDLRASNWWIENPHEEKGVAVFVAKRTDGRVVNFSVGDNDKGRAALVVVTLTSSTE